MASQTRRNTLLIVDDEELNRELLRQIFQGGYNIVMAGDGLEALEQFDTHRNDIAAVLLDVVMPKADGYEVLRVLSGNHETEKIPVVIITANTDSQTALKGYALGAAEVINKPFVAEIVKRRVTNMIEMFASRERLQERLSVSEQRRMESERQLEKFSNSLVDAVSNIVEFRDMESGQHVRRVKGLTQLMAVSYLELYPDCGLTRHKIDVIVKAAALHDIGKIVIPDGILLKPGRLTPEEREVMQSHTTKGCEILTKLDDVQDTEHYNAAYDIIRHHHERHDGRGYPDGLAGDDIPLSARLVSLADVYDALSSDRVYKKAYDKETTYQMIMDGQCGAFDPRLLESLTHAKKTIELFADSISEGETDK